MILSQLKIYRHCRIKQYACRVMLAFPLSCAVCSFKDLTHLFSLIDIFYFYSDILIFFAFSIVAFGIGVNISIG